jgi:hypothetical protein
MGKDTPEQARLRKAVADMRATRPDPYNLELVNLIVSAEAMLPKREAWTDFSECDITVDTDKQTQMVTLTYDGYIQALVSFGDDYLADRAQAIRAAVLLKHSKRLMEALGEVETDKVIDAINAEAERIIRGAGA